ncbi:hypothetical protein ACO0RG_004758 [Hanseniaspora osmophila]|uniref:Uncharacterized protein n=1 Tax=Hanseniaspora osmophila TaxID=56408 RepID=A0A1E5RZI8_9ASCO|nr:hypothetical protein AWRI3579_g228 [Hanseniaspora osmophila]
MSRFGTLERDNGNFRDTELFDNSEDDNSSSNAVVHPPDPFELPPNANSTNIMESYETEMTAANSGVGDRMNRDLLDQDDDSPGTVSKETQSLQQISKGNHIGSKLGTASGLPLEKVTSMFGHLEIQELPQSAGSPKIGVGKMERKRSILNQKSAEVSNSGVFTNYDARTVSASNSNSIEYLQKELAKSQMQMKILTDELKQAQTFSKNSNSNQPATDLNDPSNIKLEAESINKKYEKKISELNEKLESSYALQEQMHNEYEGMFASHTEIIKEYETNLAQLFGNLNGFLENNEEFLTMKKNYKALKMTKNCEENFEQLNQFFHENLTTIREYKLEQQRVREEALHEVSELTDDEDDNKELRDTKGKFIIKEHASKEVSFADDGGMPNESLHALSSNKEPGVDTRYEIDIENIHSEYHNFFSYIFDLLNQSDQYGQELENKITQQTALLKQFENLLEQELEHTSSAVKEQFEQESSELVSELNEMNKYARHLDMRLEHHQKNTSDFQLNVNEVCGDILVQFERVFEPDSVHLAKEKLYKHRFRVASDKSSQSEASLLRVMQFIRTGTRALIDEYVSQLKLKNRHNAFIEIKELNKKWLLEKYKREKDQRMFEQRLSNLKTNE